MSRERGHAMGSPLAAPSGRTTVRLTSSHAVTRHRIYKYGDRDDIPNPGDMLIVSHVGDGPVSLTTEVYIRGSEMALFADAALACAMEYDRESLWLTEPVTRDRGAA
jgi:hypothetical protein